MAEDERDRLNKLAELRKSGVLSEEEYQAARARLRTRSKFQEIEEVDATPSILQSYWPALVGLGILILLIIGVVLYGRMGTQDETVDLNVAVGNDVAAANVLEAAPTGNALCASTSTYLRIKDAIFDRAQKQFGGDPGPLESLRRSVGVRMQYPLLRGVHQDINRTDCSGRLILDLPPAARGAFDSVPALESDIQFSVQPSADGNGDVVEVSGGDDVVQQLAVAAGLVYARRAQAGALPQKTFDPSFDCGGSLSNVERMICSDEQLSQLDRALAARYQALKQEFSAAEWQQVVDSQRDFLRRRAACADVACLHDAYVAQARFLDRLNDAY
jgi:uncharacterized protein YecT (DUF1311 family)